MLLPEFTDHAWGPFPAWDSHRLRRAGPELQTGPKEKNVSQAAMHWFERQLFVVFG